MTDFLNKLLNYYNISKEEYDKLLFVPDSLSFLDDLKFDQIDKAIEIVKESVASKEKILVYGDYDTDGIMSTSIIIKMFQHIGYNADWIIPSRYLDGYGLNIEKAKSISEKYDLIIAVDNGITCNEAIDYLISKRKKVIIIDHHEPLENIPNADAIIHPKFSNFGSTNTSAGFVCFLFASCILGRYDFYLGCLGAISIISDLMPLKEYNHTFLKYIFKNYSFNKNDVIEILRENDEFEENTIGMKIAPKINSIGRMLEDNSISDVVSLFITSNNDEIRIKYEWLCSVNELRKTRSQNTLTLIKETLDSDNHINIIKTNEKEGLIGLIAGSICAETNKPTFVFCMNDEVIKCSARAPKGFDIVNVFNINSNLLINFGGHESAGGCSLHLNDLDKFENNLLNTAFTVDTTSSEDKYIELYMTEFSFENYDLINGIGPFGTEWKRPLLKLDNIKTTSLSFSKDYKHILSFVGQNKKLVGFNISKENILNNDYVDFYGYLRTSVYFSKKTLEFYISDYKKAQKNV